MILHWAWLLSVTMRGRNFQCETWKTFVYKNVFLALLFCFILSETEKGVVSRDKLKRLLCSSFSEVVDGAFENGCVDT
jgi:hypothetical protein